MYVILVDFYNHFHEFLRLLRNQAAALFSLFNVLSKIHTYAKYVKESFLEKITAKHLRLRRFTVVNNNICIYLFIFMFISCNVLKEVTFTSYERTRV